MVYRPELQPIVDVLRIEHPDLWREWIIRRQFSMSSGMIPEQLRLVFRMHRFGGGADALEAYHELQNVVEIEAARLPKTEADRSWAIRNSERFKDAQ